MVTGKTGAGKIITGKVNTGKNKLIIFVKSYLLLLYKLRYF